MKIFFLISLSISISACSLMSTQSNWEYKSNFDSTIGEVANFAYVDSTNSPLKEVSGTILLRERNKTAPSARIFLNGADFNRMKFIRASFDQAVHTFPVMIAKTDDGLREMLYFNEETNRKFLLLLTKAKQSAIEIDIHYYGNKVFYFNVDGIEKSFSDPLISNLSE